MVYKIPILNKVKYKKGGIIKHGQERICYKS